TLLTDSNWENIRAARMKGLETFYGNPVSSYADQRLDLVGINRLMGLSPLQGMNGIAAMRYQAEFGQGNIFALLTSPEANTSDKHRMSTEKRGHVLFGDDVTYGKLASLLTQGAEIRSTKLSEEFDYQAFRAHKGNEVIPLFAINPRGRLYPFVAGQELEPAAGWTLITLYTKPEKVEKKQREMAEEGRWHSPNGDP